MRDVEVHDRHSSEENTEHVCIREEILIWSGFMDFNLKEPKGVSSSD